MRNRIKKLPVPVIILISVFLVAVFMAALRGSRFLLNLLNIDQYTYYLSQCIGELPPLAVFILISVFFGYSFIWKENRSGWREGFYRGGFLTVYCGASLAVGIVRVFMTGGSYVKVWEMLVYVLSVLLVGVTEELVFRGVILNILLDRFHKNRAGITLAIILDGILFGLVHILNVLSGASLLGCLLQAFGAVMLGIILAYTYVRTRNLKLVMLYHFLIDLAGLMSSGLHSGGNLADAVDSLGSTGILTAFVYALMLIPVLLLLKKTNMEKVAELENGAEPAETAEDTLGISRVSMIMGIISTGTGWMMGYSIGFGALGLAACSLSKKRGCTNRMTKAGMILSIAGIILGILAVIGFSVLYAHLDLSDLYRQLEELYKGVN